MSKPPTHFILSQFFGSPVDNHTQALLPEFDWLESEEEIILPHLSTMQIFEDEDTSDELF